MRTYKHVAVLGFVYIPFCCFLIICIHQVSLEKSAEASQELDRQRDVYRDFARAGSTLFFLVEAMQVDNADGRT